MKKINGRGCIVEKCCVPRKKDMAQRLADALVKALAMQDALLSTYKVKEGEA